MIKIGEVAAKYDISNRTLRYWEETGILKSCRMENGYRYYDELNVNKIRQIKLLRKLRLPIQDIQRVFVSGELSAAVEVLTNHMEETKNEAEELKALGVVLERLIEILKSKQGMTGVFEYLEVHNNSAALKIKNALQITLSERKNTMSQNTAYNQTGEVRIINLPRMIVASYCAVSETPENDCTRVMDKLIREHSLYDKPGFRHFGFNSPSPEPGKTEYGYEMWAVVPEDFEVPKPFIRKEFNGGLYAAIPTFLPDIGERWGLLYEWVQNNENYEVDWNPDILRSELEECMDYITFNSEETLEGHKQLDLLMPIKRVCKPAEKRKSYLDEVVFELSPKRVTLPQITLGGCVVEQKANSYMWKKYLPWYKLAQTIYKSGKSCMEGVKAGNNTFTLVYGKTLVEKPFYLAGKHGIATKVFMAVEITKAFETYPEGLEERILPQREYLLFSVWIAPEKATSKGLPSERLYTSAAEYLEESGLKADFDFCLEREYRKDGKTVDKVELYVPLIKE